MTRGGAGGRNVRLSDAELLILDGRCSEKVQAEVDSARARLVEVDNHPGLDARLAGFIADVVREARITGRLIFVRRPLRRCSLCGRDAGYYQFKSGRRKGKPDWNRPLTFGGYDLADRSVRVQHHATLGGCADCIGVVLPHLVEALRGAPVQVPDELRAEGEPVRLKHRNRKCSQCGWTGHEGEMGSLAALMGGSYPGRCPSCGAENRPLGQTVVEIADGFVVGVSS